MTINSKPKATQRSRCKAGRSHPPSHRYQLLHLVWGGSAPAVPPREAGAAAMPTPQRAGKKGVYGREGCFVLFIFILFFKGTRWCGSLFSLSPSPPLPSARTGAPILPSRVKAPPPLAAPSLFPACLFGSFSSYSPQAA